MASRVVAEPLLAVAEAQNLAAMLLSIGLISAVPKTACAGPDGASGTALARSASAVRPTTVRAGCVFLMPSPLRCTGRGSA
jgi:hypothetical protein